MAFPSSPTNGQQTTQNGVIYTYDSTLTAWILTTSTTGNISANAVTTTGNITTGANFLGAGLSLTGNVLSALNVTGNITGANITTSGLISATANITGGNISTTGNVTGGNITLSGAVSAVSVSSSGNVTGGNVVTAGAVSAVSVSTSGNITGGNITGGNITVSGNITASSVTTSSIPLVLDDISNQCDGAKMVFQLTNNLSNITSANITDSKNLQVAVNGLVLSPWVNTTNFIWYPLTFAGFPTRSPGYQVNTTASSANVTFYRSPAQGSQVVLTIINNSSSTQVRKYPFTATYIALGV